MAINFPNSPIDGETVIINGVEYSYDSTKLIWKTTDASGASVPLFLSTVSNTANSASVTSGLAFNSANAAFNQANTATTIATSAFDTANTKVSTVAGVSSTTISNNIILSGILSVDGVGSTLDADLLDGLAGGGSGFYALKANNLSVFASTTSAQLAGVISDETGSGSLVFATSPTLAGTPQVPTAAASTSNNMIASTAFAASASNLTSGTVPTGRLSGSYTGITGVGTISAGTWQASSISTTYTDAKVTSVNGSTGAVSGLATLSSPSFSGTPTAPTSSNGTITTAIATTFFAAHNSLQTMTVALSDETTALTTGEKLRFRAPFAMTLYQIPRLSCNTASSSGLVRVDIRESGTTIFSTNLTIDANETTSTTALTSAALSDTSIADDAEITFHVIEAGTGANGLKATLYYRRT